MCIKFAGPINVSLDTLDHDIKVIAEPGRYYVSSACTAGARVIGKKMIMQGGKKTFSYFVSDGIYRTFMQELLGISTRHPVLIDTTDVSLLYRSIDKLCLFYRFFNVFLLGIFLLSDQSNIFYCF